MATPASRFVPNPASAGLELRLLAGLSSVAAGEPVEPVSRPSTQDRRPAPLAPLGLGLAVEVDRVVPASGNLAVRAQQFWLGPDRAGAALTLWADTTVVHLFIGRAAAEEPCLPAVRR
jgi:hypothetical protein